MSDGLYVAMSGAVAQEHALDVVANNVANSNTEGFRAERLTFQEVLDNNGKGSVSFVSTGRTAVDSSVGELQATGNPLDLAIDGKGWFGVRTPNGVRYTRDGAFEVAPDGTLIDGQGHAVLDAGGNPILVPPDANSVHVDNDGQLFADAEPLAALQIVELDPEQMQHEGGNLYSTTGQTQAADGVNVVSGHLESSNFDPVRGMVDLIRVSRTHESLHRMMEAYRQIDQRAVREIGGPG